MNGVFTSRMVAPPHNPLTLPAHVAATPMNELWDYKTHAEGRAMREYVDTLWAVKTVKRKPSPTNGLPCTVILAQRDLPAARLIYFHDLGLRQRFPGAHRVDAHTLLPSSLRWRKRKIPAEDRIYWEQHQKQFLDYWRAQYLKFQLPLAERRRLDIRGRLRDWLQPRSGYQAVLASEMKIENASAHNTSLNSYSYLREALVAVPADGQFSQAFAWNEEPLLYAKIWEPMQVQAGLEKIWQRVWYIKHDDTCPEYPQHLDCVDPPRDRDLFVNHRTLCCGQDSELWGGVPLLLDPNTRASGPRRHEIDWLKSHKPA